MEKTITGECKMIDRETKDENKTICYVLMLITIIAGAIYL